MEQEHLFNFQDLQIWQKAVEFSVNVIQAIDRLDAPRKHYRLIEQIEAASTSIAMNIAEGKGRQSTKEFIQFLYISRGSCYEVVTLLMMFQKLGWLSMQDMEYFQFQAQEIIKMLNSMIKSLKNSN